MEMSVPKLKLRGTLLFPLKDQVHSAQHISPLPFFPSWIALLGKCPDCLLWDI